MLIPTWPNPKDPLGVAANSINAVRSIAKSPSAGSLALFETWIDTATHHNNLNGLTLVAALLLNALLPTTHKHGRHDPTIERYLGNTFTALSIVRLRLALHDSTLRARPTPKWAHRIMRMMLPRLLLDLHEHTGLLEDYAFRLIRNPPPEGGLVYTIFSHSSY